MRWRWWRRGPSPADVALKEAQDEKKAAQDRHAEIRSVAARLREIRDANHFAESIRRALGDSQ